MDQRIFAQLDLLERGARVEARPERDAYNNSSAGYSAYEGEDVGDRRDTASYPYRQLAEAFAEPPMVLDEFDEQLLRQPDYDSRHGQSALDQARLSLMPDGMQSLDRGHPRQGAPGLSLSRFAFEPGPAGPSSSSPGHQRLHSSPAFKASQRRPMGAEFANVDRRPAYRPSTTYSEQESSYQPVSVDQLEEEERRLQARQPEPLSGFLPNQPNVQPPAKRQRSVPTAPVVQGITLVSTHELPDRFRAIFPFPLFNAVQSKCFETIYQTSDNFVTSAPTGSGKTAVLELAICRLINTFASGTYKIVYQAPTKSLCAERQRDWQAKFGPLDLQCAELTGDTDVTQLRNVQHATIIITTPEKWDSMTRKWKDHQKLIQMVKLFLIDEVHILKEDRGATLEAVVSRMKSVGSNVRFVALSATVPNSQDIAAWLGKDSTNPHLPAMRERFGEEFRPVRLQKHVRGYQTTANDFAFEKTLNAKLPEVITKWSHHKPIMVFCFTRKSCVETAKLLAIWWAAKGPRERFWTAPRGRVVVGDKDLRDTISSGVAFHHAGLQIPDRMAVEKGYLEGDINVICCTSTLAVGVNLPCHMVIIKNTVTYQNAAMGGGCKEYSDLEIMQMLGRAGRPQFDDSAVAVIMTRLQRVLYYENMITGHELLESCLHRNLIDHLNAEIGLGTVTSVASAKTWLSGTFLYVRLKENPDHYKLDGDMPGRNLDERLENICSKGIALLEENSLVKGTPRLQSTEYGDAMARYYLQFGTMQLFLALPPKAKISEILSAIAQGSEFQDIRFRAGEKPTYKSLNSNISIKFPIPVNLDASAHKVSLVIQSVLGMVELPTEDPKQRNEYMTAKATIFQHVHRLIRCIIDCQLYLNDAVSTRNALMLARSFGAQVWDDSPLHMKQLDGVGPVAVRKLAMAGVKSIEDIENAEARRLEQILSRNPPYGGQLQEKARAFPKPMISLKAMGEPVIKKGEHVTVKVKAEIGFLNEKVPETFQRKPVYVCLLVETSDGHKVHFARISAKKLNKGQDVLFSVNLISAGQSIHAYVMCDEIAGTARHATLRPEIPAIAFPPPKTVEQMSEQRTEHAPNTSKRHASAGKAGVDQDDTNVDFGGLNDEDLVLAEAGGFVDVDDLDNGRTAADKHTDKRQKKVHNSQTPDNWQPQQLANSKWACNHACKDKTSCKHMCCREGVDKKPKPPKQKEAKKREAEPSSDPRQTQLSMAIGKKSDLPAKAKPSVEKTAGPRRADDSRQVRDLNRLHNAVESRTPKVPIIGKGSSSQTTTQAHSKGSQPQLSFLEATRSIESEVGQDDYDMDPWDLSDLPTAAELISAETAGRMSPPKGFSDSKAFDDEPDAGNSHPVSSPPKETLDEECDDGRVDLSSYTDEPVVDRNDDWQPNDTDLEDVGMQMPSLPQQANSREEPRPKGKGKALFLTDSTDATANETPSATFPGEERDPEQCDAKRLDFERVMQPVVDEALSTEPPLGQAESAVDSSDEVKSWFQKEFGTELFNYVD